MTRPVRILQVLGAMELGGAETWLMHVLRNSAGVTLSCLRKMRLRWLWSENPLSRAISFSASRSLRRCWHARSTLRLRT